MFEKIRVLALMQLSEKKIFERDVTFLKKLGAFGKMLLYMGIAYGIMVGAMVLLKICNITYNVNVFSFFIAVLQVLSIISCVSTMYKMMYLSKDNQLLLTYPCKHIYVYISKLVVSYIFELKKNLIITLPCFMAYATIVNGVISFPYVIMAIVFTLVLPLFPVLIGTIIGIPVALVSKLLKKNQIFKLLGGLLVLGLTIFLTIIIVNKINESYPIEILRHLISFFTDLDKLCITINQYTLYCNYMGQAMYGINPLLNILYIFVTLIVLIILSLSLSIPCFFRFASSASEHASAKKHLGGNMVHKNIFGTFMRKEVTLSIRDFSDFISNYLFLFIMPFIVLIMTAIFMNMKLRVRGVAFTYGFLGLYVIMMLSASNTASATAISSEGNEFTLLKTSPANSIFIIWAKMLVNFVISTFCMFITFLLVSIELSQSIKFDTSNVWLLFGAVAILNMGMIFWSTQMDVMNPKLREFENSQSRTEVSNFSTSIVMGCLVGIIFSAIAIIMFWLFTDSPSIIAIVLYGVAVLFTGLRLYFLINYVKAYFQDIQL